MQKTLKINKTTFILFQIYILFIVSFISSKAFAQDNYEIQVYKSETEKAGITEVELHSNFGFIGNKNSVDGIAPTNHQLRETIEITHGFNDWFETGIYFFTTNTTSNGYNFVGTDIRPRIRLPDSWKCPVGLSLSMELSYTNPAFSTNSWGWEIRPIIDKTVGKWYVSFNPVLDRAIKGNDAASGFIFSPNYKIGYKVNSKLMAGIEYYNEVGSLGKFNPLQNQSQQLVPVIDWDFAEHWDMNIGMAFGLSNSTDKLIFKTIIAHSF